MAQRRFRRPAMLDPATADSIPGDVDPALRSEIAHDTANALINRSSASSDREVRDRVMRLVETEGIELLATLWSDMPPRTLPGTLWRLFALLDWVRRDPGGVATCYSNGLAHAEVEAAVAGAAVPPGPGELSQMSRQILSGAYDAANLDVALERAAAFSRVMATGTAIEADAIEDHDAAAAQTMTRRAASLLSTAGDLAASAALWRAGRLE